MFIFLKNKKDPIQWFILGAIITMIILISYFNSINEKYEQEFINLTIENQTLELENNLLWKLIKK